jgi:hypothetical protein
LRLPGLHCSGSFFNVAGSARQLACNVYEYIPDLPPFSFFLVSFLWLIRSTSELVQSDKGKTMSGFNLINWIVHNEEYTPFPIVNRPFANANNVLKYCNTSPFLESSLF